MDFLEKICHFPIQELDTGHFPDCSWLEMIGLVPQLKILRIGSVGTTKTPQESQLRYLKHLPLIIHTKSFKINENEDIVQLCQIMETVNIRSLIIDHYDERNQCRWSLSQFKMCVGKFPIYEMITDCFDIDENNIADFLHVIAGIKGCRVSLQQRSVSDVRYLLTLKDIELMVKLDIKVTVIDSDALKTDGEVSKLLKFADLIRKMNHLEDFSFAFEEFENDNILSMEKLTDIPIKHATTGNFLIQKETINDVVKILSQMKCLEELVIAPNFDKDYKLTVNDLALFQNLPVKRLHLNALDLKKDNVEDFRQIMRGMKIKYIGGLRKNFGEGLEISEQRFGPGNRYVTI